MPSFVGQYTYEVSGNFADEIFEGIINVTEASEKNHGPVKVTDKYHFCYSDGTPYYQIGTTCYAWLHQPEEMRQRTLKTLAGAPLTRFGFVYFQNTITITFMSRLVILTKVHLVISPGLIKRTIRPSYQQIPKTIGTSPDSTLTTSG